MLFFTIGMDFFKNNWKNFLIGFFVLSNLIVWGWYFSLLPNKVLKVVFLNVGQGDSIYIRAPSGNDLLVDSGPRDRAVLRELGAVMPWNDNDLDVILETHADADHIGGFPDILKRFNVGAIVETGNHSKTNQIDGAIEELVKLQKIPEIIAHRGTVIDLGDGVKFTILFPDKDVVGWETNMSSIVGILSYGSRKFLLTGDSPTQIENYLVAQGNDLKVDVLKPGHHGSRTSTGQAYVSATKPAYAVISAGLHNRYGHPTKEVMNRLASAGVKIFQTAINGPIEFDTNGSDLIPIVQFKNSL
ncbi:MAG: ComEC/Rec2 family competence protein [Minisyncoccia bacterium]